MSDNRPVYKRLSAAQKSRVDKLMGGGPGRWGRFKLRFLNKITSRRRERIARNVLDADLAADLTGEELESRARLRAEHVEKAGKEAHRSKQKLLDADLLKPRLARLKKVTEVPTPFANNLRIIRDGKHTTHASGTDFAEFALKTRQQLTEIAATTPGQDLFKALQAKGNKKIAHQVRIQDAGPAQGIRESSVSDDLLGSLTDTQGAGSTISHHTDIASRWHELSQKGGKSSLREIEGVGMSGALALGHELIHATRAAHGLMVGTQTNGVSDEERQTIGTTDGRRTHAAIPTENAIRLSMAEPMPGEHNGVVTNIGTRTKYGDQKL